MSAKITSKITSHTLMGMNCPVCGKEGLLVPANDNLQMKQFKWACYDCNGVAFYGEGAATKKGSLAQAPATRNSRKPAQVVDELRYDITSARLDKIKALATRVVAGKALAGAQANVVAADAAVKDATEKLIALENALAQAQAQGEVPAEKPVSSEKVWKSSITYMLESSGADFLYIDDIADALMAGKVTKWGSKRKAIEFIKMETMKLMADGWKVCRKRVQRVYSRNVDAGHIA